MSETPGDWSLPAALDAVADAVGDREMLVWTSVRRTHAEVQARTLRARRVPARRRPRRAPRACRPRALGVRPEPGRGGAVELPRIHRDHDRRVPGANRAVQRQPSLPPRRGRGAPRPDRRRSDRVPPPVGAAARVACPGRPRARRRRRRLRCRTTARQRELRSRDRGRRARRRAPRAVARRPVPRLHRRHDGPAQGRVVAPGRHLRLRNGRHRGRDRGDDREKCDIGSAPSVVCGTTAHARRGPVDRVRRAAQRRHRRVARRCPAVRGPHPSGDRGA